MKIFLDVGAYIGAIAKAVLTSKHYFDKIHCFEPQKEMCDAIREIGDDRIVINEFGLWNQTCIKRLHFVRRKDGASIYPDKFGRRSYSKDCKFVKASDWFAENLNQDDYVVLKINCEGAECDILEDLIDSGEYNKVDALMVDFDVRKIMSQKHREDEVRKKLELCNIPSIYLHGTVEEASMSGSELRRYYHKREAYTHYWMDRIIKI